MEEVKIKAELRKEKGSASARLLRRKGFVPAVVYGKGKSNLLKIENKELSYLRRHHFSENVIINLEIPHEKKSKDKDSAVLLKDYQVNPLTEEVIHLDFIRVSMKEKVTVEVPVETKGEAKGIKAGGAIEYVLRKITVECLPMNIPDNFEVDVSDLDIGHSIHVENLTVPEGVTILTDPKEVIITMGLPAQEEEPGEAAEGIEAAPEEPEVIKEKPKEGKAEEADAAQKSSKEKAPREKQPKGK